ncbi:MAG: hypothetical protein LLF98_11635 [Clostridium sp.]|uniref:hypothetical protein n=1 Tax=Clostridium sp. TaxID=1506 RepID=UPI0025C5E6A7|nr:hypothetical protein [Clostridium sp.]MCE5221880.1 hypothetical protein [Clostridium sp.]
MRTIDKFYLLAKIQLTPNKTKIVQKGNSISIKHVNKKGTVKHRFQCSSCLHLDNYQAGLGFVIMPCCSRDDGWREMWGETASRCKFYKEK